MTTLPDSKIIEFLSQLASVKRWIEISLGVALPTLPEDFVRELKTGIVLCFLAQKIDPRSVPRVVEDRSKPLRLRDNIAFFLAACSDLGVPRHRLFVFSDLENGRAVPIVDCLVALSEVAVRPPTRYKVPLPDPAVAAKGVKIASLPSATLASLRTQIAAHGSSRSRGGAKTSSAVFRTQMVLKMSVAGGSASLPKVEKGVARFQALWRGYRARESYKSLFRDQAYREKVASEILSTEREYVNYLATTTRVFMHPLIQAADLGKPIIKREEIASIFGNIEQIHAFHISLLDTIEERVAKGPWTVSKRLGDIFLRIVRRLFQSSLSLRAQLLSSQTDFVDAYSTFVRGFTKSSEILQSLKGNSKFQAFLQNAKDGGYSKLPLPALLIMPVQRMPRIVLLLLEYAKHTSKDHPDKEVLTKAIDSVKGVVETLNNRKREAESLTRVREISDSISNKHPELVRPGSFIVKEDVFSKRKGHGSAFLALFNDSLLWCSSEITHKMKFESLLELWSIDIADDDAATAKDPESCAFVVKKLGAVILELNAKTVYEKSDWIKSWAEVKQKYDDTREKERAASPSASPALSPKLPRAADAVLVERKRHSMGPVDSTHVPTAELLSLREVLMIQLESTMNTEGKDRVQDILRLRKSLQQQLDEIDAKLRSTGHAVPREHSPLSSAPSVTRAPSATAAPLSHSPLVKSPLATTRKPAVTTPSVGPKKPFSSAAAAGAPPASSPRAQTPPGLSSAGTPMSTSARQSPAISPGFRPVSVSPTSPKQSTSSTPELGTAIKPKIKHVPPKRSPPPPPPPQKKL